MKNALHILDQKPTSSIGCKIEARAHPFKNVFLARRWAEFGKAVDKTI